ncbi:Ribokinase-like protein [Podospora fimiseda]|uniref:Ribokinase n=1 Tax=Podospora fimiseda TaxID=252190 RepID=A0AAN7BN58_9PEZI|nr:Ribokinase-like protein [Podospora fimiseda]
MATLPKITILGSLNIDLVSYVPHHPLPGETLSATSFKVSPGGKGANQAVACGKLSRSSSSSSIPPSAQIKMVGAVGSDTYGTLLLSNLSSYGVDPTLITSIPNAKTGIAIIIVDEPTGENRIVLSAEANNLCSGQEFIEKALEKGTDLLIMQLEIPMETVLAATEEAKRRGIKVLLNPAPAKKLPEEVYQGLAHLIVNETEASILGEVDERELDTEEGLERVSEGFIKRGVENVVITLGARGVYYMDKSGKKGLVEAEKGIKVVDTTAAGDTFVGRYALDVVGGGFDIEVAVKKGNKASAITVQRAGAQDSIPWKDEVE